MPQHELLACAQCGCFAFSCFEDFAIRVNRPLNEHLSKVLPKVVEEIRRISKDEKILLIFDRGGYSGALFKSLSSQGIEFITYLKGRKAKRRFPSNRFETRWYEVSDPAGIKRRKRHVYKIYEKGDPGSRRWTIEDPGR